MAARYLLLPKAQENRPLYWYINVPDSLNSYSEKLKNINAAPTGKETALHESVTLIPGVGHFVPQVKPEEFNAVLSKIISEYQ
jgi:pimeloyl-ACP methyl ester carboxylesterase